MSVAACISASSAGDLIIRQPRTTGLALTIVRRRQLLLQPVEDEEAVGLLDADRRAGEPALAQEVGDQLQRLLILVPGADFGRDCQAFLDRRLLEEGRDDDRIALGRDDRRRSAVRAATIGRR